MPTPAIVLTYTGTGTATAEVTETGVSMTSTELSPITVAFESRTLEALCIDITGATGGLITATLADAAVAAVRAAALLPDGPVALAGLGRSFARWTNPVWQFGAAFGEALAAAAARLDAALAQLNLLTSAGFFANLWGRLTGTVRRTGEADDTYTIRQLHELLRPRENNEALAALIEEDAGVAVTEVRDLRRDVLELSGGPLRQGMLPGRDYNACVAEVRLEQDFPSVAVLAATRGNVAAGIACRVRGTLPIVAESTLAVYLRDLQVGEPPAMTIGTTAIGVGKVGP
jgi:hypothetical protein